MLTYHSVDVDPRRSTLGRESDFGLVIPPGLDDQTTFLMSEPPADGGDTSPLVERSFADAAAYNAAGSPNPEDVTTTVARREEVDLYPDTESEQDLRSAAPVMIDDQVDAYVEGVDEFGEEEAQDETIPLEPSSAVKPSREPSKPKKRQRRISKHGIEYPALPPSFVKRVAQTALQSSGLSNPRVSTDTLTALTQASEWFFEQLGDDLGAYANHAKRDIVEESDVATLMRRYGFSPMGISLRNMLCSNIIQTAPDHLRLNHVLPCPTAFTSRITPGVENAHTARQPAS